MIAVAKHIRRVFRAELVGLVLHAHQGAHERMVDDEGNPIGDSYNPRARLTVNIGDTAIVSAADLDVDQLALVEVITMHSADRFQVLLLRGTMPPSGRVHVVPAKRARPAKRTPKRKPLAMPGASIAAMVRRQRERLVDDATPQTTTAQGTSLDRRQIPSQEETSHGHDTARC